VVYILGGFYCEVQGAEKYDVSRTDTGMEKCAAGYYCKSGNSISQPTSGSLIAGAVGGVCPTGHYCPIQTEVTPP